jgi:hypothetical protein
VVSLSVTYQYSKQARSAQVAELQLALTAVYEALDLLDERTVTRKQLDEVRSPPLFDDNHFAAVVAQGMNKARAGNR